MHKNQSLLLIVVCLIILSGCSLSPKKESTNQLDAKLTLKKQEVNFLETYGKIKLEFDENVKGWITLESTGTAPLNFNQANSREEAFMLANMRAQRNLIEFLSSSIKSEKFTNSLSKVMLDDLLTNGISDTPKPEDYLSDLEDNNDNDSMLISKNSESRKRVNNISQTVKESIAQSAEGIIKGAMVVDRRIDPDVNMVAVTIKVSQKSIDAANEISNQMGGI